MTARRRAPPDPGLVRIALELAAGRGKTAARASAPAVSRRARMLQRRAASETSAQRCMLGAAAWVLQRWQAHDGAVEVPVMPRRWLNEALLARLRDEGPVLRLR